MHVQALRPADLSDWLAFFDGPGFADNPDWSSCYCRAFLVPDPAGWDDACASGANRAPMCDAVREGRVDGFLARDGGAVVGWIHTGPVTRFNLATRLRDAADREPDVAAIACLLVARAARRRGVARALVHAAVVALGDAGFARVRAWPRTDETDAADSTLFHGPRALYLAEGFVPVGERGHLTVMERRLA
jgi:ribosomal protein S18 acetylase RimI-like enzyme